MLCPFFMRKISHDISHRLCPFRIAHRRRVFKVCFASITPYRVEYGSHIIFGTSQVETVGDCYVAVAGLPDPRPDHAVIMARFARECVQRMQQVVQKMEVELGPDTGKS